MPLDLEFWKQWEGQNVDSLFPLDRCIGAGSRGAVFETKFQGEPAAIKLVPGTSESIAALEAAWEKSATLTHPALVRCLAHGEATLGETQCAYFVMERAEDNLADVLAERPLTPAETLEMLTPLLGVLGYLHTNGYAHGSLKPTNIMAFGEQLKVSSDALVSGGDPAVDSAAIGGLLREVLGITRPAQLPAPFAEIAKNCSLPDTAARWRPAQIEAFLRGDLQPKAPVLEGPSQNRPHFGIWILIVAAAALLGVVAFRTFRSDPPDRYLEVTELKDNPVPASSTPAVTTPPTAAKPVVAQKKPRPTSPQDDPAATAPSSRTSAAAAQRPVTLDGITQVLPDIPQPARNTISGRVRINVRVRVDGAGSVQQATLEPPRTSKYFSERALAAARSWKFPAGSAPQDWVLHFELSREQTRVSASKN